LNNTTQQVLLSRHISQLSIHHSLMTIETNKNNLEHSSPQSEHNRSLVWHGRV